MAKKKKKVLKVPTMDQAEKPDIHLFKSHRQYTVYTTEQLCLVING